MLPFFFPFFFSANILPFFLVSIVISSLIHEACSSNKTLEQQAAFIHFKLHLMEFFDSSEFSSASNEVKPPKTNLVPFFNFFLFHHFHSLPDSISGCFPSAAVTADLPRERSVKFPSVAFHGLVALQLINGMKKSHTAPRRLWSSSSYLCQLSNWRDVDWKNKPEAVAI